MNSITYDNILKYILMNFCAFHIRYGCFVLRSKIAPSLLPYSSMDTFFVIMPR